MAGRAEKRSIYLPSQILREIQAEAERQDRSVSWVLQESFLIAREELKKRPSASSAPVSASNGP